MSTQADAAEFICWDTKSGTFACTDDDKRVPKLYRQDAYKLDLGDFKDYPKLTIEDRPDGKRI